GHGHRPHVADQRLLRQLNHPLETEERNLDGHLRHGGRGDAQHDEVKGESHSDKPAQIIAPLCYASTDRSPHFPSRVHYRGSHPPSNPTIPLFRHPHLRFASIRNTRSRTRSASADSS